MTKIAELLESLDDFKDLFLCFRAAVLEFFQDFMFNYSGGILVFISKDVINSSI